jgi:hypothetical protein
VNARMHRFIAALVMGLSVTCGSSDDKSSSTSAVTGGDTPNPNGALPASAAGTPDESGPGVPADFAGTVTESLPLTAEDRAAIQAADALSAARNPATQSPLDRGFGAVSKKRAP